MKKVFWRSTFCIMISILLLLTPASAAYPPSNSSWTLHRGNWENQGITVGSDSPETDHELWNNSTAAGFTCDPVAANVTFLDLGGEMRNVIYTATPGWIQVWDAWTGELLENVFEFGLVVDQILVDDPFIIVKTPTEIRAYATDISSTYWSYTDITYEYGPHLNETAGHITPGLNRIQLVQHQVIVGIVNGSDSNYSTDPNYNGHRAFRADYDISVLSCIWYRDLNSEVWNTPATYVNMSGAGYGGNNTTIGSGIEIPGYGAETPLDPEGDPTDVGNRNVIFFTVKNWLYCLRADDGAYSIIQNATANNASLTNPRLVSHINDQDTYPNPVVVYHMKTAGNNSWDGGDGTWNSGQTPGCDAVFFMTSDGYANGICLWDSVGIYEGMYTWREDAFNITPGAHVWWQSFAVDESFNLYNDNPTFNDSFLFIGDGIGWFYQIPCSDGIVTNSRNMAGGSVWFFGIDSPIFDEGRVYTLMHNGGGDLKIECLSPGAALATHWNRQYIGPLSNMTGYWNPEPCLAFDAVFVCAHELGTPNIWAQRDNEPPIVDCGEGVIYPVIGQQYDLYNATASDPDGTITNYTWDLEWGYRYTLDCNFTFWVHQSTTGYLNVTDNDGATASDSFTIIPQPPPIPNVNISWGGRVDILNNTEEFNGTNTTGTNLTWWNWSVEDPNGAFWYNNGTNLTINYTFTIWADTYNVTLNVTDEWDQGGEQSVLVYIYIPDPPTANISWDEWAVANITETFNGSTNSHGTNLTWWNWTIEYPNGTFWYDNGTNDTIDFIFDQVNETYNVTLNVTDEWGQSNNTTIGVFVNPTEQPQFNWTKKPTSGYARDVLRYTFTSNNTTYVIWNWGDGSTSNTSDGNTTHTWSRWGTFTVTVTVWNEQGVSNTTTFTVRIGVMDLVPLQGYLLWFLILIVLIMIIKFVVSYLSSKNDSLDL